MGNSFQSVTIHQKNYEIPVFWKTLCYWYYWLIPVLMAEREGFTNADIITKFYYLSKFTTKFTTKWSALLSFFFEIYHSTPACVRVVCVNFIICTVPPQFFTVRRPPSKTSTILVKQTDWWYILGPSNQIGNRIRHIL